MISTIEAALVRAKKRNAFFDLRFLNFYIMLFFLCLFVDTLWSPELVLSMG